MWEEFGLYPGGFRESSKYRTYEEDRAQNTERERTEPGFLNYPHLPPGNPDRYQKKGVAGGAIRMNVKTKELEKLGQTREIRGGDLAGMEKAQIGASYTGQTSTEKF